MLIITARIAPIMALLLLAASRGDAHWIRASGGAERDLYDICLLDGGQAWAVGDGRQAWHSGDGGATWLPQWLPDEQRYTSVSFISPISGWASGEGLSAARTTDGQSWSRVTVVTDDLGLGPPDALGPVVATGEHSAWALARWGDATLLYRTSDGGAHWETVRYTDRGYNSPGTIFALAFASHQEGWLVASRITGPPAAYTPVFLHTTDGGDTWRILDAYDSPLVQPSTPAWSVALDLASPRNLLAHVWDPLRATGRLYHVAQDGNGVWWQTARTMDDRVRTVSFPDPARAWVVGEATHQSVDYGHTFRTTPNPTGLPLAAAFHGTVGVAAGPAGALFRWIPDTPGDVDADGVVTLNDALAVLAMIEGGGPGDALTSALADVHPAPNGDGLITLADAAAVLRVAAGVPSASGAP